MSKQKTAMTVATMQSCLISERSDTAGSWEALDGAFIGRGTVANPCLTLPVRETKLNHLINTKTYRPVKNTSDVPTPHSSTFSSPTALCMAQASSPLQIQRPR